MPESRVQRLLDWLNQACDSVGIVDVDDAEDEDE